MHSLSSQGAYQSQAWSDKPCLQSQTLSPSLMQRVLHAAPAQSLEGPVGVTPKRDTLGYQSSPKRRRLNPRCSRIVLCSSTQEPAPNGSSFSESTAAKVLQRYGRSQQALKRGLPPVDWHRYHLQILFVDRCVTLQVSMTDLAINDMRVPITKSQLAPAASRSWSALHVLQSPSPYQQEALTRGSTCTANTPMPSCVHHGNADVSIRSANVFKAIMFFSLATSELTQRSRITLKIHEVLDKQARMAYK